MSTGNAYAKIEKGLTTFTFKSSFNNGIVEFFRGIPKSAKKAVFNDNGKFDHWIIDSQWFDDVVDAVQRHMGFEPEVSNHGIGKRTKAPRTEEFIVEYIGTSKQRSPLESPTSLGRVKNNWSLKVPESVLKDWFSKNTSYNTETLYGVLGVVPTATEAELKKAYRLGARRFHPDVNDDDDAADLFRAIDEAYKLLCKPDMRRRYDASLKLANKQDPHAKRVVHLKGWPVRCGKLTVYGVWNDYQEFEASQIIKWEDVYQNGRLMVSYWSEQKQDIVVEYV